MKETSMKGQNGADQSFSDISESSKKTVVIEIQPQEQNNHFLPYPFFIDEEGMVGRQDFWKGKPKRLLGFNDTPFAGDITLHKKAFFENPKLAIGKYPVMKNKNGGWVTHQTPIESVRVLRNSQ